MTRPGFTLLLIFPFLTACTSSLIDLRHDLDVHRSSFEEKLMGDAAKSEQFHACTRQAHDGNALPLTIAAGAPQAGPATSPKMGGRLRAPVQALVEQIHDRDRDNRASLRALTDMVDEFADPAQRRVDLGKLRQVSDAIHHWHAHLDFDEEALGKDSSLFARLLLTYNKAYFRDV